MRRPTAAWSVLVGALLGTPNVAAGQVNDLAPPDRSNLAVEAARPSIAGSSLGAMSSVWFLRAITPAGDKHNFFLDWGFAYATLGDLGSRTIGNPEIGIVFERADGSRLGHLSFVLPLSSEYGDDDFATTVGAFSNFLRADLFAPDVAAINTDFIPFTQALGDATTFGVTLGVSGWVPTSDGDDLELFLQYGAFVTATSERARFGLEFDGRWLATQQGATFGQRSEHQLTAVAALLREGADPELFVRLPLDSDLVDVVIGFRVVLF